MKKWQKLLAFALAFGVVCTVALGITGIIAFGNSYIEIDTADKLRKIGVDADYPLDGDYRLTADIDLSDEDWYGIGYNPDTQEVSPFTGTIDGQGHIISGMHYGSVDTPKEMVATSWGLVCTANQSATVAFRNIVFENVVFNGTSSGNTTSVGAVIGYSNQATTIENVAVLSGYMNATSRQNRISGIMGCFNGSAASAVTNCYNGATITGSASGSNFYVAASGIVGGANGKNLTMSKCVNVGNVSSLTATGTGTGTVVSHIGARANGKTAAAFQSGTSVVDCYGLDGLLSVKDNYISTAESTGLTVLSAADVDDASKYTALTSGWVFADGYYPRLSVVDADYAIPAGITDTVISIETAAELRKIGANDAYPMSGVYYRLMNDIDLSDANWIGAGVASDGTAVGFGGTFDGQGHKISNMHAYGATKDDPYALAYGGWGLFPRAAGGAVVKNLVFDDIYLNGNAADATNCSAGAVFGYANVNITVENVAVLDGLINISCQRQTRVGGIIGTFNGNSSTYVTIKNCYNGADITGSYTKSASSNSCYLSTAGILGAAMGNANYTVENCLNVGNIINSTAYASKGNLSSIGGIVAKASPSLTPVTDFGTDATSFKNCYSVDLLNYNGTEGMHFPADQTTVKWADVFDAEDSNSFKGLTDLNEWTVKAPVTGLGETVYYYPMLTAFEQYSMPVDIIYIDSAEELRKIGTDAEYPMDGNYKLTTDVDVSDEEWVPLGDDGNVEFTGVFNGGGHVISGMNIGSVSAPKSIVEDDETVDANAYNFGMFEYLGVGAKVCDLAFADVCLNIDLDYKWLNVGTLSAYARAGVTVENVAVLSGLVSGVGQRQVSIGGLIGRATAEGITVKNCFNAATVVSSHKSYSGGQYAAAAGIVGDAARVITIENCLNIGQIKSLKIGTAATNFSSVGNIVAAPRTGTNGLVDGSVLANGYGISGTLSYVTGSDSGPCVTDKDSVTVVDLFSVADETEFAGLTAGTDSAWTVKADSGNTSYYPMLKMFEDHSIAIDRDADLARLEDLVESLVATNYMTKKDVVEKLAELLTEYSVDLTLGNEATAAADGEWDLDVTLSDGTTESYKIAINRLPAIDYTFALATPGIAQGTVTVTLPSDYAGGEYALYWGNADGLLSGYSYITLMDDFTVNGNVLTYEFPDLVAIPVGATHLWLAVDGVSLCSYELPENRALTLGNLKYTYGLFSDVHFGHANAPAAFTVAMDLFESANAAFAVSVGDFTEGGSADQYKIFTDTYTDGGWDLPVWSVLGNHDILVWNLKKVSGATSPYDPSELAVTPAEALQNMKNALETYAKENYVGANNEYKVTLSEYYPDYDYTVAYNDDLFVYMGIGALKNDSGSNRDQHLAANQLVWLEEVLEEYYNTADSYGHVYLIFHYYTLESGFGAYQNGSTSGTEWSQNRNGFMTSGYASSEALFEILNKYPNVIHFSGHTHRAFDADNNISVTRKHKFNYFEGNGLTWTDVNEDLGYVAVHTPSLTKGGTTNDEGYLVSVYENGVLLTGYNFYSGEVIPHATFFLSNELDEETRVRVNDGKIQYVKGYGEWLDLIKTETLASGEIDVQVSGGYIQWKTTDATEWNNLIAIDDLDGLDGKMMQIKFDFNNAPATLKYGDEIILSAVGGQSNTVVTYSVVSGPATIDAATGLLKITGVGEVKVKAVLAGNDDYVSVEQTLTVTAEKRPVTVTADNKSKTYGAADPALTYKAEGLVGNDILTGTLKYTGTNVGTYDIVEDTAFANANYEITFVKGTMTITKKAVTVTADNKTKTYGAADPALTYKAEGLVGNDTLTGTLKYTGTNAGTYDIVEDTAFANANYEITFVKGTMTITKKAVTVTADNKTKTYGAADPALTYKAEGLVGNDTLTGTLKYTGTNVGTYDIVEDTAFANDNYDITFVKGTMTITKKAVTVTADNKTKTVGEADPVLTYKAEGLIGNDTLTGTLKYTGTEVGTYDIVIDTGFVNPNYEITFVKGTMTINAAPSTDNTQGSTDSTQGSTGSSGTSDTTDTGNTSDTGTNTGNTGSATNSTAGTDNGNPDTSDRNAVLFAVIAGLVTVLTAVILFFAKRKKTV